LDAAADDGQVVGGLFGGGDVVELWRGVRVDKEVIGG